MRDVINLYATKKERSYFERIDALVRALLVRRNIGAIVFARDSLETCVYG